MRALIISCQPAVIEPTGTTQDGHPVIALDGALYAVHEVVHSPADAVSIAHTPGRHRLDVTRKGPA